MSSLKTMFDLTEGDIFQFSGRKVKYKVCLCNKNRNTIKVRDLINNRFREYNLNKIMNYNGTNCEMGWRSVEVENK